MGKAASEAVRPDQELFIRRNFYLGVVNGALFTAVKAMLRPTYFLSVLVDRLTGSSVAVGGISAVLMAGGLLPQVILAKHLEPLPRMKQIYFASAVLRVLALAFMIASLALIPNQHALFWTIAALMLLLSLSRGLAIIPFTDLIANTIPVRRRGAFFGLRGFYGGILAAAAGPLMAYILSERSGLGFPTNYALLFAMILVASAVAVSMFLFCEEAERTPTKPRRESLITYLRRSSRRLLRDRNFVLLFLYRAMSGVAVLSFPFFGVYAIKAMGMPVSMVGVFMSVHAVSYTFSNLMWMRVSDRRGNRMLLILTACFRFLAPAAAVVATVMPEMPVRVPGAGQVPFNQIFYLLVFVAYGFTVNGMRIGSQTYLLEIAPERRRPTYMGFLYTLLAPFTLMPLVGGIVADVYSYRAVFGLSMAFAAAAVLIACVMAEPRYDNAKANDRK